MKRYLDKIYESTAKTGAVIEGPNGAVVGPLDFEVDEFCGTWFVKFGLALNQRFAMHRLDLGQARFRIMVESDVQHPGGITKNEAEVKRDKLIEALDLRFGVDHVYTAATTIVEGMQICQRLWPHKKAD